MSAKAHSIAKAAHAGAVQIHPINFVGRTHSPISL